MKKMICIILLLCFSQVSFSQADADYEKLVEKVTNLINTKDVKSIYNLFSETLKKENSLENFEKSILAYQEELGKITSTEFWMEGELGNCYLLEFEQASMVLIVKLLPDNKISVFNIEEY
ncbi:DUF3887 domain-containing protein [uncultured Tenacibaculum sp.]|uniref:DUF3887 domain-containing protein n=1 Tax=uncultured Tenacibaculum sp. TaxID=174713 RepID=UPI002620DB12|nr:DUF3887 domain-containing protein [uncultured Tenacibaculum sp.]